MAWFTRFTRFGDMHFVFGQEATMTCGPSSVLMCYTKIRKLSPSAPMFANDKGIQGMYSQWSGTAYNPATDGTAPAGLVFALNSLGCGRWQHDLYAATDATQAIIDFVGTTGGLGPTVTVTPVIVAVNWDGSTASHWVVIDTVRTFLGSTYATICDPGDADVHVQKITPGSSFIYEASEEMHIDFGGSDTHGTYKKPQTGRIWQWPIIHLT